MENPVLPCSCVIPAGTSIEVQNEWEENTHTKIKAGKHVNRRIQKDVTRRDVSKYW